MVKNIKISDFDYPLPDERIARHPLTQRDACLLLVSRTPDEVAHHHFSDLPDLIPHDSILVCNDTRVINARVKFEKSTGSKIEVFLLEPLSPLDYNLMFQSRGSCSWNCLVGNLKRWKSNPLTKLLDIDGRQVTLSAHRLNPTHGNAHEVMFSWDDDSLTFASIIDAAGYIPIPPYLKRESEQCDADDYQTIYARIKGSVAAPTAGLHFTPELFDTLRAKGVDICPVTLHVGAGTFQPVKSEEIGEHPMHTETFSITSDLVTTLIEALKAHRPVTAVGTTSVRTLESLPILGFQLLAGDTSLHVSQWEAYEADYDPDQSATIAALSAIRDYMSRCQCSAITASTSIMIAPGFKWRIVDMMVTNFHQPQSTLLLLVASFLGDDDRSIASDSLPRWRRIYNEALAHDYRFLSYGDACLFARSL